MSIKSSEIIEELKTVLSSKTIDAILPPLFFVIINRILGLNIAAFSAIGIALIIGIMRLIKKQPWKYALGGLFLVSLASGLSYITKSAASYFIPAIISSSVLIILALGSLILGKPLAAWASHLSRGWPLDWFWRKDVKPAYKEVTWFWTTFLFMRLFIQITLYRIGENANLTWANILLGWPFTISILIFSYLYGLWRLKNLSGPGVDEYQEGKEPPWEGQKRGF